MLDRPTCTNWCSLLKQLLQSLGFLDTWEYQTVGNSKLFLMLVKQKISVQFIQNWKIRIDNSSRAYLYKHIKNFMCQPYLDAVNISKFRISLSQLRMSSHRLCIETGR